MSAISEKIPPVCGPKYSLFSGFLDSASQILFKFGIELNALISELDIDISVYKNTVRQVPVHLVDQAMLKVLELSNDPDYGLHFGEYFCDSNDFLNVILSNSPTIGDALFNLCNYFNLSHDLMKVSLEVKDDAAILSLHGDAIGITDYRNFVEAHFAYQASILHRLAIVQIDLACVSFVHPAPSDITEHERIFKTKILFGQAENKIVFNKKHLETPVKFANRELLKVALEYGEKIKNEISTATTFSGMVERVIYTHYLSQKTDIETISRVMGMSTRSIQIKLKEEGTKYQELLETVKRKHAQFLLGKTDTSILDITFLLGYADQSSFNRAFKKWTGLTPSKYRSNQQITSERDSINEY